MSMVEIKYINTISDLPKSIYNTLKKFIKCDIDDLMIIESIKRMYCVIIAPTLIQEIRGLLLKEEIECQ